MSRASNFTGSILYGLERLATRAPLQTSARRTGGLFFFPAVRGALAECGLERRCAREPNEHASHDVFTLVVREHAQKQSAVAPRDAYDG